MKRTVIAAGLCLVVGLAFAAPVIAVEGDQPAQAPDPNFEKQKATMLKMFDARIAGIEKAKGCVKKATNPDEVKACMEAHTAEMRKERGGARMPGGPGRPQAP
jgi:hypothetical protein